MRVDFIEKERVMIEQVEREKKLLKDEYNRIQELYSTLKENELLYKKQFN